MTGTASSPRRRQAALCGNNTRSAFVWALALIALVAGADLANAKHNADDENAHISKKERYSNYHHYGKRDAGFSPKAPLPEPFRAGREFHFDYDAQTATGFADAKISPQKAMNRVQAAVKIAFRTDTEATLRLRLVRVAQHNGVIASSSTPMTTTKSSTPARLHSINAFAEQILPVKTHKDFVAKSLIQFEAQLLTPVKFEYTPEGRVRNVRFNAADGAAARNLKRAVLNLIQLNLKSKASVAARYGGEEGANWNADGGDDAAAAVDSAEFGADSREIRGDAPNWERMRDARKRQSLSAQTEIADAWTNMEETIEGKCAATYTVARTDCYGWECYGSESKSKNADVGRWNVTKSIDFGRCAHTADVLFGQQATPIRCQIAAAASADANDNDGYGSDSDSDEKRNCYSMMPKEVLDRATVMRYMVRASTTTITAGKNGAIGGANAFALERVELISEYTYQGGSGALVTSGASNAMHTVAIAQLKFAEAIEAPDASALAATETKEDGTAARNAADDASKQAILAEWKKIAADAGDADAETLLYNANFEWREKRFYADGDNALERDAADAPVADVFLGDALAQRDAADDKEKRMERASEMLAHAEAEFDAVVSAFIVNRDDGAQGINAPQTADSLKSLVELTRTFTARGLKQLYARVTAADKGDEASRAGKQLFADALALAGTRNALVHLTELIQQREFDAWKSAQLFKTLGSGAGLVAPSDAQVNTILQTCQTLGGDANAAASANADAPKKAEMFVVDACWLTFAAMVGELSAQTRRAACSPRTPTSEAESAKKTYTSMELYTNMLIEALEKADTTMEKIVALKQCANAALDATIAPILKIAQDGEQPHDVRLHAIDALRRVGAPRAACDSVSRASSAAKGAWWKVEAGLLPIFANVRERADVRMASAALILTSAQACAPRQALADQIVYALHNDENEDVRGFVKSVAHVLKMSPVVQQRQIAQHLENALAMLRPTKKSFERLFSRHSHMSSAQLDASTADGRDAVFGGGASNARAFLNFVAIYASGKQQRGGSGGALGALPAQMSLEVESWMGGAYQRDAFQLSAIQNDLSAVVREVVERFRGRYYASAAGKWSGAESAESDAYKSASDKKLNANKNQQKDSFFKQTYSSFRAWLSKNNNNKNNNRNNNKNTESDASAPYAVLTLRNNDVDVLVLPVTDATIAPILELAQRGGAGGLAHMTSTMVHRIRRAITYDNSPLNTMRGAMALDMKMARVATSVGMSLKIEQSTHIFGALALKFNEDSGASSLAAKIVAHPNIAGAHLQSMRVWLAAGAAGVSAGVAANRAVEANLPLEARVECASFAAAAADKKKEPRCEVSVPLGEEKVRLFGAHSLPLTFIAAPNRDAKKILKASTAPDAKPDALLRSALHAISSDACDASSGAMIWVNAVENLALAGQQSDIDATYLNADKLTLPIHVHGHYFAPHAKSARAYAAAALVPSAHSSLHVDFVPRAGATPTALKLSVGGAILLKDEKAHGGAHSAPWSRIRGALDAFYAGFEGAFFGKTNANAYESAVDANERAQSDESEKKINGQAALKHYAGAHKAAHDYLRTALDTSVPYRHTLALAIEAMGGGNGADGKAPRAEAQLYSVCDAKFRACEANIDIMRTPIFEHERQVWEMDAQVQIIYPEQVESASDLDENERANREAKNADASPKARDTQRHTKLFAALGAQWGTRDATKQNVRVNLLGEPSAQMIKASVEAERRCEKRQRDSQRRRHESATRIGDAQSDSDSDESHESHDALACNSAPFIDQYNLVAEYRVDADAQNTLQDAIDALKAANFWSTKSQLRAPAAQMAQTTRGGAQLLKAALRVDAHTARYANFSLETRQQRIFVQGMAKPRFVPLIALVADGAERVNRDGVNGAAFADDDRLHKRVMKHIPGAAAKIADTFDALHEQKQQCRIGGSGDGYDRTTIISFYGERFYAPLSAKCFTKLAGDCDGAQFALYAKLFAGSGKQKTIKYTSAQPTNTLDSSAYAFEIEPIAAGDWHMAVTVNGTRYTSQTATVEQRELLQWRHGVAFITYDATQDEIVSVYKPGQFKLDFNGVAASIKLSERYSGSECGLCDKKRDESDASDEIDASTNALKAQKFHRAQMSSDCDAKERSDMSAKFAQRSASTASGQQQKQQQRQPQQQQRKQQRKQQQQHNSKNMITDESGAIKYTSAPAELTMTVEYNNKLCFSRQPVRQCAAGTYAVDASGERDFLKKTKVPVTCFERESLEAKRIRTQIRRYGVAEPLEDYPTTYSEMVTLPERCVEF